MNSHINGIVNFPKTLTVICKLDTAQDELYPRQSNHKEEDHLEHAKDYSPTSLPRTFLTQMIAISKELFHIF